MTVILSVLVFLCIAAFLTPQAHAIIFLPAIILIPIAKIVAIIIGGFSFPTLGIGALWSKLFGKSLKKTIIILTSLLLLIAVALVIIFKIHNPYRPLF